MFCAISAWRSFSTMDDSGTSRCISTDTISATISPKYSTGRAIRQGLKPVACMTTSSLSWLMRLVT